MKKISLQRKIVRLFCITSIIPIIVLSLFSYRNISVTLRENTSDLTQNSLKQIDDNLHIWLESYEDLLYQIYTDDDMVKWVDSINVGEDVSLNKNQMRRYIQGLLNTKDYIRSITIITENGTTITYDQLTAATYKTSWLDNFSMSASAIYAEVASDYNMHIFPTEYGTQFAGNDYYFMHIAHRIIDYKDLDKKSGIVVISIDEELLQKICAGVEQENSSFNTNFIVDQSGRVIAFNDQSVIGTEVTDKKRSTQEKINDYIDFTKKQGMYETKYTSVYTFEDKSLGWDIVNVTSQRKLIDSLENQIIVTVLLSLALFAVAMLMTALMSKQLISSVNEIINAMKVTRNGNMSTRVPINSKMPVEIESIAVEFNDMLEKLQTAIQKEWLAGQRKKEAQIIALEAQINPHFIYNTLDTINWMAIDRGEYDISNTINALATILRYAIVDSNAEVYVKDEIEWLKKYVYLQQYRLKNTFVCRIDAEPEALKDKVHKMLLQPFVENAIIHGLKEHEGEALLTVCIKEINEKLMISITDNGVGMSPQMINEFNSMMLAEGIETTKHIGIGNAITRLRMYYGDNVHIEIDSELGKGTEIRILLSIVRDEKRD